MRHIAVTGRDDISFTAHQGVVETSHLVQTYPRSVPLGTGCKWSVSAIYEVRLTDKNTTRA